MPHAVFLGPHLLPDPIEGLQPERAEVIAPERHGGLEDGADHHAVPRREDRPVHRGHRSEVADGLQLLAAAREEITDPVDRNPEGILDRLRFLIDEQDVLHRVVVFLPSLPDFVDLDINYRFFWIHYGLQFLYVP